MDDGHIRLIEDLKKILDEAEQFQFHDFRNEKYAAPKMELVRQLEALKIKAMNGHYDN